MIKREKPAISVFDYTDYRKYLFDYYNHRKKIEPDFTYRSFATAAGVSSTGLYKEVVDGRRNLTQAQAERFALGLRLSKKEAEFFSCMVAFNDAPDTESQKILFRKMLSCYDSKVYKISADQFEYFGRWYYVAVRELIACGMFREENSAEMAKMLIPAIRTDQVRKSFEVLERLGLVRKNETGFFERSDAVITTGYPEADREAIKINLIDFQKGMAEIASGAYDRFDLPSMDMSTLTLAVSENTFSWMKEELAALRKRFLERSSQDQSSDRIYQLNQQFFPLTRRISKPEADKQ